MKNEIKLFELNKKTGTIDIELEIDEQEYHFALDAIKLKKLLDNIKFKQLEKAWNDGFEYARTDDEEKEFNIENYK